MREISCTLITDAIERLCMRACTMLPPETAMLIDCAIDKEESPVGREVLIDLFKNFTYAGLNGLPMGIAAVACFGGSFTNALIFKRLKLGDNGRVLAVMLEPLTQADIITKNPIPIYGSNFFGGALSGIVAAVLGIVNNAPGTASPIPGMLAPFAFNDPMKVVTAMALAAVGGTIAGFVGSVIFKKLGFGNEVVPD